MRILIVIATIWIIIHSIFIGITNKIKESEVYETTKEVVSSVKEVTDCLLNKDIFIENDLVKINEVTPWFTGTGNMEINFLLENKSLKPINVALEEVKVNGLIQEVHESSDGRNSVKENGGSLFASYALFGVDLWDESARGKEFQVEGYVVIQDYETRKTLDRYRFSKIYKN